MLLVFGIIGETIFEGAKHYRCGENLTAVAEEAEITGHNLAGNVSMTALAASGNFTAIGAAATSVLSSSRRLKSAGGGATTYELCNPSATPGSAQDVCAPLGAKCVYFQDNPSLTDAHYDNVIDALTGIVQVITFDTWTNQMYDMMRVVGPGSWIFFFIVMLIGGFFVVNVRERVAVKPMFAHYPFLACASPGPPFVLLL